MGKFMAIGSLSLLLLCTVWIPYIKGDLRNIAITGPQMDNLTLGQTPELLEMAAKTGEQVRVDLTESRVLAVVQEGVNVSISCLPCLELSPNGGIIRWSFLGYQNNFKETIILGSSPVILQPPGNTRRRIEGRHHEFLSIPRTVLVPGDEESDTGEYICEVCPSLDAPSNQCMVNSTLSLQVIGAQPVLDRAEDDKPISKADDEVVFKIGSDFCIPRDYRGRVSILCDAAPGEFGITQQAYPTPSRAWSADGDLLYSQSVDDGAPNLREPLNFYMQSALRMVLYPDVVTPPLLNGTKDGRIEFNFKIENATMIPRSITLRQSNLDDAYTAVAGEWTCELSNVFGSDTATSTISVCPGPDRPGFGKNIGITGSRLKELTRLGQNPELLELAARRASWSRVELNESRVLAVVPENARSIYISCLPWLKRSPVGDVIRWTFIRYDNDFTAPISAPSVLQRGSRHSIFGTFNEWLSIRNIFLLDEEVTDTGVYMCEVCPSLEAPTEQCNVANLTLQVIGAPPVIVEAEEDEPISKTHDEVVYRIGSDFCIPHDFRGRVSLSCDIVPFQFRRTPRVYPAPERTWSADGDMLYQQSVAIEEVPNLRDNLHFFVSKPHRRLLFPGTFSPSLLSASENGRTVFDFGLQNATLPSGIATLEQAREAAYKAVVGNWTCELSNTLGEHSVTSEITICPTLGPSHPLNVKLLSNVVVWGPPAVPRGVITEYEVRFQGISSSRSVFKAPSYIYSYYIITSKDTDNLGGVITVQVRARTSFGGYGPFSEPIIVEGEVICTGPCSSE